MNEYLQLISVPAIVSFVYWAIAVLKFTVNGNETFNRMIPLISCCVGIGCGVAVFYLMPEIIPAQNLIVAIVIGGASGLSATGVNQILKQKQKSSARKNNPIKKTTNSSKKNKK